jgi:hypothetical protein
MSDTITVTCQDCPYHENNYCSVTAAMVAPMSKRKCAFHPESKKNTSQ